MTQEVLTIGRWGTGRFSRWVPGLSAPQLALYILELLQFAADRQPSLMIRKGVYSWTMLSQLKLRGLILRRLVGQGDYKLLICENQLGQAVVSRRVATKQILDLPSPFAEELYFGGLLSSKSYQRLKEFESSLYSLADYTSFHWHTYTQFVKGEKYSGDNLIDIGYGAPVQHKRARYSTEPRLVFLGYLGGYWVNLPLLERLSAVYPIDVYGGPEPKGRAITYRGYAPSMEILAEYQFGLITVSTDPLRRCSFSSKQLDYYSFGLPVLTPEWRTADEVLDGGAIHYSEATFGALVDTFTVESRWQEKSDRAIEIARRLSWDHAFEALGHILDEGA